MTVWKVIRIHAADHAAYTKEIDIHVVHIRMLEDDSIGNISGLFYVD